MIFEKLGHQFLDFLEKVSADSILELMKEEKANNGGIMHCLICIYEFFETNITLTDYFICILFIWCLFSIAVYAKAFNLLKTFLMVCGMAISFKFLAYLTFYLSVAVPSNTLTYSTDGLINPYFVYPPLTLSLDLFIMYFLNRMLRLLSDITDSKNCVVINIKKFVLGYKGLFLILCLAITMLMFPHNQIFISLK